MHVIFFIDRSFLMGFDGLVYLLLILVIRRSRIRAMRCHHTYCWCRTEKGIKTGQLPISLSPHSCHSWLCCSLNALPNVKLQSCSAASRDLPKRERQRHMFDWWRLRRAREVSFRSGSWRSPSDQGRGGLLQIRVVKAPFRRRHMMELRLCIAPASSSDSFRSGPASSTRRFLHCPLSSEARCL